MVYGMICIPIVLMQRVCIVRAFSWNGWKLKEGSPWDAHDQAMVVGDTKNRSPKGDRQEGPAGVVECCWKTGLEWGLEVECWATYVNIHAVMRKRRLI